MRAAVDCHNNNNNQTGPLVKCKTGGQTYWGSVRASRSWKTWKTLSSLIIEKRNETQGLKVWL